MVKSVKFKKKNSVLIHKRVRYSEADAVKIPIDQLKRLEKLNILTFKKENNGESRSAEKGKKTSSKENEETSPEGNFNKNG